MARIVTFNKKRTATTEKIDRRREKRAMRQGGRVKDCKHDQQRFVEFAPELTGERKIASSLIRRPTVTRENDRDSTNRCRQSARLCAGKLGGTASAFRPRPAWDEGFCLS